MMLRSFSVSDFLVARAATFTWLKRFILATSMIYERVILVDNALAIATGGFDVDVVL